MALQILSLEDDEEDFEFIKRILTKARFDIVLSRVDTKESFTRALIESKPDVILSDHSLPDFDSTEALVIAKNKCPEIPFILVTGAVSDEFAVKTLKLGADDYLLKSNLVRLPSVIENAVKQKEAELARAMAAKELANRNEELSKINRELDSFVYSVSHNLRAPLMSVLGLVNLASQEGEIHNVQHYHQLMKQSILKLDATLMEILEYSRNARQEIKIEAVDFQKILDDNLEKMQFIPGFKEIEKDIKIRSPQQFYSDSYRLSVIFNNLISNAVKYADRTKATCKISVIINVDDDHANLIFTDNGIGIDKELQPKVFDMFFRATQSKEGAGLGLYIVREAIELLNGDVEIDSTFGQGTTFRIRLPNQVKKQPSVERMVAHIDKNSDQISSLRFANFRSTGPI